MARSVELIIEDGSGVEGANSFATEDQIVAYAAARGVVIAFATDADKDAVAILGIKAMDYLRAKTYIGSPVEYGQPLPFPREGMYVNPKNSYEEFPTDEIPAALIEAQCRLALEIKRGVDVMPTVAGGSFVVREKVGPIETEYSEKIAAYTTPDMPMVDALLAPFLDAGGFGLRVLRV